MALSGRCPRASNCQAAPTPDRRATVHQAMLTPSASMPGSLIATPRGRPEIKEPRSAPVTRAPSVTDMQIFVLPAAAHNSRKSGSNALDVPHAYSGPQSTLRRSGASAFGRDRRDSLIGGLCPVHSYANLRSERPNTAGTFARSGRSPSPHATSMAVVPHCYEGQKSSFTRCGVPAFPQEKRGWSEPAAAIDAPHAYSTQKSTLRRSGATAFGREKRVYKMADTCLVHSYSGTLSTLKRSGASAFPRDNSRAKSPNPTAGAPHAYSDQRSTLNRSGVTPFPRDKSRSKSPTRTSCLIHSYSSDYSSLRRSGASAFGRMPARPDHMASGSSMSRTGLLVTAPASRPSTAQPTSYRRLPSAPTLLRAPQHRLAPPRPTSAPSVQHSTSPVSKTQLLICNDASPDGEEPTSSSLKITTPDDLPTTEAFKKDAHDDEPSPTSVVSPMPRGVHGNAPTMRTRQEFDHALAEAQSHVASPAA